MCVKNRAAIKKLKSYEMIEVIRTTACGDKYKDRGWKEIN